MRHLIAVRRNIILPSELWRRYTDACDSLGVTIPQQITDHIHETIAQAAHVRAVRSFDLISSTLRNTELPMKIKRCVE